MLGSGRFETLRDFQENHRQPYTHLQWSLVLLSPAWEAFHPPLIRGISSLQALRCVQQLQRILHFYVGADVLIVDGGRSQKSPFEDRLPLSARCPTVNKAHYNSTRVLSRAER
jgi:hypothetical protein